MLISFYSASLSLYFLICKRMIVMLTSKSVAISCLKSSPQKLLALNFLTHKFFLGSLKLRQRWKPKWAVTPSTVQRENFTFRSLEFLGPEGKVPWTGLQLLALRVYLNKGPSGHSEASYGGLPGGGMAMKITCWVFSLFLFLPVLLRCNWHTALCKFKVTASQFDLHTFWNDDHSKVQ